MEAITLIPFTPNSPHFEDALMIYIDVFHDPWTSAMRYVTRHSQMPQYVGLAALHNDKVVGMGFGTQSLPGQWWHDRVAAELGIDHPALQQSWVLAELGVLAPYRNRGIGGRLHDALTTKQPLPNLLLSTAAHNHKAQRFYTRRGWKTLHSGITFARHNEPYVIMQQSNFKKP